jgi:phenylacetate-CoA ligase
MRCASPLFHDIGKAQTALLNGLCDKIRRTLQASVTVNSRVELVEGNSLPVSEGKAKRIQDPRPKDA